MGRVSRSQLPGEGEDVLSLSSGLFWCLIRRSVHVDRRLRDDGKEGSEKEVRTLCIEVHRQRSIEVSGRNAEGHDGNGDGGAGNLGEWVGDGAEWWKVGTVRSENDIVGWVQGNLVATVRGSVVGLSRVDSEHVGGHLRREIVDHDGELLREGWRMWQRSRLDTPKDLVHFRPESSETLLDVIDGSLGEFRVNGGESFAVDFLIIGAGKMPGELDGRLLHDWSSRWLDISHLDILDRNGEGFEAETKGLG